MAEDKADEGHGSIGLNRRRFLQGGAAGVAAAAVPAGPAVAAVGAASTAALEATTAAAAAANAQLGAAQLALSQAQKALLVARSFPVPPQMLDWLARWDKSAFTANPEERVRTIRGMLSSALGRGMLSDPFGYPFSDSDGAFKQASYPHVANLLKDGINQISGDLIHITDESWYILRSLANFSPSMKVADYYDPQVLKTAYDFLDEETLRIVAQGLQAKCGWCAQMLGPDVTVSQVKHQMTNRLLELADAFVSNPARFGSVTSDLQYKGQELQRVLEDLGVTEDRRQGLGSCIKDLKQRASAEQQAERAREQEEHRAAARKQQEEIEANRAAREKAEQERQAQERERELARQKEVEARKAQEKADDLESVSTQGIPCRIRKNTNPLMDNPKVGEYWLEPSSKKIGFDQQYSYDTPDEIYVTRLHIENLRRKLYAEIAKEAEHKEGEKIPQMDKYPPATIKFIANKQLLIVQDPVLKQHLDEACKTGELWVPSLQKDKDDIERSYAR